MADPLSADACAPAPGRSPPSDRSTPDRQNETRSIHSRVSLPAPPPASAAARSPRQTPPPPARGCPPPARTAVGWPAESPPFRPHPSLWFFSWLIYGVIECHCQWIEPGAGGGLAVLAGARRRDVDPIRSRP